MAIGETVYFTINNGVAPSLTILQIENKTYNQNDLPLNITVDEQVSWMGYSLDGKTNVTLTGNITLNQLNFGSHSLVVYANDTDGNMGTTNQNFSIEKAEVFPALPITTITLVAMIVVAGLLVYYNKHKSKSSQSRNFD